MNEPEPFKETFPTFKDLWKSKDETAQAILRFPRTCPLCDSQMKTARHQETLGHVVGYWCGIRMHDNAGHIQRDWTRCGVKEVEPVLASNE